MEMRMRHPQLADDIGKLVGVMDDGYQIMRVPMWKNLHVLKHLLQYKPKSIVEFGSGTTTATFNYYLQKFNCLATTYESHPGWHELLQRTIPFGDGHSYLLRELSYGDNFSMFADEPPFPDMVYVDGPPIDDTHVYNRDAIEMLERGARPKTIMFDVRVKTVLETEKYVLDHGLPYSLTVSANFPPHKAARSMDPRHSVLVMN